VTFDFTNVMSDEEYEDIMSKVRIVNDDWWVIDHGKVLELLPAPVKTVIIMN